MEDMIQGGAMNFGRGRIVIGEVRVWWRLSDLISLHAVQVRDGHPVGLMQGTFDG